MNLRASLIGSLMCRDRKPSPMPSFLQNTSLALPLGRCGAAGASTGSSTHMASMLGAFGVIMSRQRRGGRGRGVGWTWVISQPGSQ